MSRGKWPRSGLPRKSRVNVTESPAAAPAAGSSPASEAARQLAAAWRDGRRLSVEDLLVRNPPLAASPKAALRLISEELLLRHEAGEVVDAAEVVARFPQWRAELEVLLACHELFEAPVAVLDFPQPGERCGDFDLLREIGRGSQGRVFLAAQPSLSNRPVVVKLAPLDAVEHLSLARLQHTGIVPLYLAEDLPERRLRLLCMPFMGGASLAAVLAEMKPVAIELRSGQTIVEALRRCHLEAPNAAPFGGPAVEFLSQASYVQAVCWIGASLAEALHYAHQRGLMHFDIKPSNLLLASDGQPMLLDFHLARGPVASGKAAEWVGGTQQYMPPEQGLALAAVRCGGKVPQTVDASADIYALAMVLDEMLGGEGPLGRPVTDNYGLEHLNRQVTHGLADVLKKCLSASAEARYADAQSLADDLRRHLADLPLLGVRNRSLIERWQKWRRRRPHAAVRFLTSAVALAALAAVIWLWAGQRISESQTALVDGQQWLDRREYDEAIEHLQRGLTALEYVPSTASLKQKLRERLQAAQHGKQVGDLHKFVDRLRFLDGGSLLEGEALTTADRACQVFWSERERLLDHGSNNDNAAPFSIRNDLVDLLVFWLDIRSRLAALPSNQVDATALLDQAEALLGPSEVLRRERQFRLGEAAAVAANDSDASSTRDHTALGHALLRAGDEPGALKQFRRAVQEQPQDFWANYYRGRCAYRLGLFDEALSAFSVCVALAPDQAECFYNRAVTLTALNLRGAALNDYDRAVRLDPKLSAAVQNRAALREQLRSTPDDGRSAER